MNDKVQPTCWGVAAKAVLGIACLMALAWLAGGIETTTVLAAG